MALQVFKEGARLMGNWFEISVVSADSAFARAQIGCAITEIQRIERLLTTFSPDSETARINAAAGLAPVGVSTETFDLIRRAQRISELTQGAFDLSYGSLDKRFWNFDTSMTVLPDAALAQKAVQYINYKNIILDHAAQSVFLADRHMRIGFGGIGKGYAADAAKRLLQKNGVESGIINASGDLIAWGQQPTGEKWTVGIADPDQAHRNRLFSYLEISDNAIATSGNYEKFVVIDGKKYSHTIDPKTGFPVSGIKSVTVIAPHAELADVLTTPIMVMGIKAGLHLINQIPHIGAIIVDEADGLYTSKNINIIS